MVAVEYWMDNFVETAAAAGHTLVVDTLVVVAAVVHTLAVLVFVAAIVQVLVVDASVAVLALAAWIAAGPVQLYIHKYDSFVSEKLHWHYSSVFSTQ